jgi:ubiquinone/menaquinone biosynthesis C-methylase UbiE
MKPFEAMAMEKALLVSSVDALTEIVADGETGVVFEKGNIDSLVDALERMVQDPDLCVRLGKRAREWVVNNRRWDQAAATIREVYRNIQQPIPLPRLVPVDNAESDLWERLTTNPREIARQAAVLSYPWDGRILDIGMGHGYVACLIARAHQPELIVGVDVEMRWARYARRLARANGIDNILASAGTAEALPFGDRSFDRVIITQVLEHVDRPDKAIREIARVLKPEGSVLIAVPSQGKMPPGTVAGHVQDFSIDEMLRMIREAGLEVIEHRKVGVREFYFVRPTAERVTSVR